jgi:hypothetical protein
MNATLPELRLAIIGGCIPHQHDNPPSALFQRRLARMVEENPGITPRPSIVRDFELDLRARLERIPSGTPNDGVLAHVRTANVVVSAHLLRRREGNGRSRLVPNSALSQRRHANTLVLSPRSNLFRGREKTSYWTRPIVRKTSTRIADIWLAAMRRSRSSRPNATASIGI